MYLHQKQIGHEIDQAMPYIVVVANVAQDDPNLIICTLFWNMS